MESEEKYCTNCKRSVATNNFAIHSAFCERNICVCKICNEPVGISKTDEHFDNFHVISPCALCEASIEKWLMPDHMTVCPKRLIACGYCEAEFPLNEYTEHVEFCGSRTEKCLLCKKYIMMKDKAKHTELHRCEQKYNRKKIKEEIKQNKVNEVISNLENCTIEKTNSKNSLRREEITVEDPKIRIRTNFEGIKESAFNKTSCDSEIMEQDFRIQSLQGAIALPGRSKEKSSRYGECYICKQSIPWIDMNTHIPSCASLAGKCSLCGEDVPNQAMKDHMRGHLSGNFETQSVRVPEKPVSYYNQDNATKLSTHFDDGMKLLSKNDYHCPFCLKTIPEEDKQRHERNCQRAEDSTHLDSTYFSKNVSQELYECPLCCEKVSEEKRQTHVSFDCKVLLENNGPYDTFRGDSSNIYECPLCMAFMPQKDKKKHELFECEVLIANSGVHIPEPEFCTNVTKKTCHCSSHMKSNSCKKCKSIPHHRINSQKPCQQRTACHQYNSKYRGKSAYNSKTSDVEQKGAVPKKTSICEMETNEPRFGFKSLVNSVFKTSSNKEKGEKDNTNRYESRIYNSYSYSDYQVPETAGIQPIYFQDVLVPCEFCDTKVPASELVLHETGCQPDLVSYTKQIPTENLDSDKSRATCDNMLSNAREMKESVIRFNKTNLGGMVQPFFPKNSFLTSDHVKHERKPDTKRGEFLQFEYEKNSSRNSEEAGNKLKEKKEECSSFQSVWNSESYRTEDHSEQMSKAFEDPMEVDQFNECSTTMKCGIELVRKTSEEILEEDDMNAFFSFLNYDRSNKFDREYEIKSVIDDKRTNLIKEHVLQENYKDCSYERNAIIEEKSSRLLKENLKSIDHSSNNGGEMCAAIQQFKNLQTDASAAIAYSQIPIETNTFEKKDEEPEISNKQKISLDNSTKSNEGLIEDFKKYLPDLKFASPKVKSSSDDDENEELFARDDEQCKKLFEKQVNKSSVCDRLSSKEECIDNLKNWSNFKTGMYQSSEACCEKNVSKTKDNEKLIKQCYEKIYTSASYSEDSRDFNNDLKNYMLDLKLTTNEKSDITRNNNRFLSVNNEEKCDEAQENYITDTSKHIWTSKDDRKLESNSYNLTDSEIAHLKSERCSMENTEHETFLQSNILVEKPMLPFIVKTADENECISNYKKYFPDFQFAVSEKPTYTDKMSENEIECSNDFKKYLPDFKFGSKIARSSKDKNCFFNPNDKKGLFEESAFQLQSTQLSSNKSEDVQEDSMKKIKDFETRIPNIRKQDWKATEK